MTDKEIKRAQNALPHWENGKPPVLTAEQERKSEELSCRDMINSILCYNGVRGLKGNRYLIRYVKELGADTVDRLVEEQVEDFNKATVIQGVYIDSEGCSYSSIIWADDK